MEYDKTFTAFITSSNGKFMYRMYDEKDEVVEELCIVEKYVGKECFEKTKAKLIEGIRKCASEIFWMN
jgi:hypothetical protein